MAQTKRSLSEIYALLANNSSGDISETDVRDAIATIQPDHGEICITSSATTTISDTVTWVMANGTYSLSAAAVIMDWDMNSNGQLRYTGTPDRVVHIATSFSITSSGTNKTYSLAIAKNGTVITPSIITRKIGTGSDIGTGALHGLTTVSTNDYITLVVRGDTDSTNVTLNLANIFVMGMAT